MLPYTKNGLDFCLKLKLWTLCSGWQDGSFWGSLTVSSGASRSTRASWKWSRKLLQRSAATAHTEKMDCTFETWSDMRICDTLYKIYYTVLYCSHFMTYCHVMVNTEAVVVCTLDHWSVTVTKTLFFKINNCFILKSSVLSFQQNVPMVFLPVHKSHIDYLLITLILFCHNIKAPHIAAGNNLSIPILR